MPIGGAYRDVVVSVCLGLPSSMVAPIPAVRRSMFPATGGGVCVRALDL
jgi:hypothetical protein